MLRHDHNVVWKIGISMKVLQIQFSVFAVKNVAVIFISIFKQVMRQASLMSHCDPLREAAELWGWDDVNKTDHLAHFHIYESSDSICAQVNKATTPPFQFLLACGYFRIEGGVLVNDDLILVSLSVVHRRYYPNNPPPYSIFLFPSKNYPLNFFCLKGDK